VYSAVNCQRVHRNVRIMSFVCMTIHFAYGCFFNDSCNAVEGVTFTEDCSSGYLMIPVVSAL
jgi:hypothetical protein